jgi:hypothetical protein
MIYKWKTGPKVDFVNHKRGAQTPPNIPLCGAIDDKILVVVQNWKDTDCPKCLALRNFVSKGKKAAYGI